MPNLPTVYTHESDTGLLPELKAPWAALLARTPPEQALFSFDWYDAWCRTLGRIPPWTGRTLTLEARAADGTPVAFLPLAERRQYGLRMLSLAGYYQPFRSFPCRPDAAADAVPALLRALDEHPGWDLIKFGPIDAASPERQALFESLTARRTCRQSLGKTIVNPIRESLTPYLASKTGKRARYHERRWLREHPGARIDRLDGPVLAAPGAARRLLRDLADIERRSWLADAQGDFRFVSPDAQAFWEAAIRNTLAPDNRIQVWIARTPDKPVAFRFLLSAGPNAYSLACHYDRDVRKYNFGWILLLHAIQYAIEHGIRQIDRAPHDLQYKKHLGGIETDERFNLFLFPPTPKGAVLHTFATLRKALKRG